MNSSQQEVDTVFTYTPDMSYPICPDCGCKVVQHTNSPERPWAGTCADGHTKTYMLEQDESSDASVEPAISQSQPSDKKAFLSQNGEWDGPYGQVISADLVIRGVFFDYTGHKFSLSDCSVWETSNNSFYIAPANAKELLDVRSLNGVYRGTLSADAMGVAASLVAFSRLRCSLSSLSKHSRELAMLFDALHDYAHQHQEAERILAVINKEVN